jgi:hypothetical protein
MALSEGPVHVLSNHLCQELQTASKHCVDPSYLTELLLRFQLLLTSTQAQQIPRRHISLHYLSEKIVQCLQDDNVWSWRISHDTCTIPDGDFILPAMLPAVLTWLECVITSVLCVGQL